MKTIGIIGGMSWESSAEYYRLINQQVKARLGAAHSAKLVMYSLDFELIARLELEERWDEFAVVLVDAAKRLERAGVEFILLASNTAHKAADSVQAEIKIPLLHIADAAAEAIAAAGIQTGWPAGHRIRDAARFLSRPFAQPRHRRLTSRRRTENLRSRGHLQ